MRKRSAFVILGLVAAAGVAWMASCDDEPTHESVCMDVQTQLRAEEADCDNDPGGSHYTHIYYPISSRISHPPVGSKVAGGYSLSKPAGSYRVGSVPSRGGFGGRGGSFVGG